MCRNKCKNCKCKNKLFTIDNIEQVKTDELITKLNTNIIKEIR